MDKKLWGGRFEGATNAQAAGFHSSISFDSRLYKFDILGSIAHAKMLGETGIIEQEAAQEIVRGLQAILVDIESGKVAFDENDEDIHMNIERVLTERIGENGKKLHTGRSRNDQVALDTRMFVKQASADMTVMVKALMSALIDIAQVNLDTIMPAYTHLQKAQPTTLAHYIMAYCEMFYRDCVRFDSSAKSADVMPLGAGALCATTYPLDREMVADELGFAAITNNSMDAVSDRDFILDFIYACSVCAMHLSRFCEEIILWSSNEFNMVTLSDSYSTGSSIMPQKKNPDMAELIRGKTGRVYGDLMSLLTVMKGLPLAYNKDMQEDKEALFDAYDTMAACLPVFTGMMQTATWNKAKMKASAGLGFTNATDAADYLTKKGLAFRDAHEVVGKLVLMCEQNGKAIDELSIEDLKSLSPMFEGDVFDALSLETCVDKRNVYGGPSADSVKKHIELMIKFTK
ncbi:MAG: argininosuccinate lyase [Clostridia bacterium]|jgi:argininosuccinate lyase|nr:argininosuccinate lyase [Clostridia bacterium]MBT7122557.1 argininosuccinate lyase [Clostridia bacterium]